MQRKWPSSTLSSLLIVSVLLRVGLILYSEWHDAHSLLKYTDVDYFVFSDATRFLLNPNPLTGSGDDLPGAPPLWGRKRNIAEGVVGSWSGLGNPYTRETYRYTPLLAVLLAPNEWIHRSFGKYLFAACDIVAGLLIYRILLKYVLPEVYSRTTVVQAESAAAKDGEKTRKENNSKTLERTKRTALLCTAAHLLNPLVFTISTRGSSEAVLSLLVLLTLSLALERRYDACAALLGASTHWKIYPVVYGVSCAVLIASEQRKRMKAGDVWWRNWASALMSGPVMRFAGISAGIFVVLTGAVYAVWGYPFLYEALLYHLHRRDHRHNFSPYFYLTYLTYPISPSSSSSTAVDSPISIPAFQALSAVLRSPLVSFVPQMGLALGTGLLGGLGRTHLPFVWFVQTAAFVIFNKVCTSQYFLWYLFLLPLLLPSLSLSPRLSRTRAVVLVAVWAGSQALWLAEAYKLEFLGQDVFLGLWVRGLVYVVAHTWVLGEVVRAYADVFVSPPLVDS